MANYDRGADWNGLDGNVTTVGSAGATSFYGAFDMGGNVAEWIETVVTPTLRASNGGGFASPDHNLHGLSGVTSSFPASEFHSVGFRVARTHEPG